MRACVNSAAFCVMLGLTGACTDSADKAGETGDTGDSGSEATSGLPEGSSTWSGTMEVGGSTFLLDFTLENTGGEVEATATFTDDPDAPAGMGTGTYTLKGTHEPVSGLLALAPIAWVVEPELDLELLGATATYDPATGTLQGMIVDYATGESNTLLGGPMEATMTSGDGAPTVVGDLGAALSTGSHTFVGTIQCTSSVREVEGTLEYDGAGAVAGTMTIGDTGLDTPLGTFAYSGVHNPSTGGLTLAPGLWVDSEANTNTFFVNGSYDASSGAFTGDQLTNTAACPPDTWNVTVD